MSKIKGWKKIVQGQNIRFSNENTPISILIVKYDLGEGHYFYSSGVYDTFYNKRLIAFKDSKNKNDAIKQAINYMRSHPNG